MSTPSPATPPPEVIAGPVVRELVALNEREIDALRLELEAALGEADEAERRLAALSGADVGRRPLGAGTGRPRTTVVTRTRPAD